jgi:hypothetical protein
MGNRWSQVITSTSTGTGTTDTQLNGGTDFITSNLAGSFVEVAPVQAATGAYTAAETSLQKFRITSTSLGSILPKRVALTPTHGGLGTFAGAMVPIVKSYPLNVKLLYSNTPLQFFGQAYVANTAAFRVGATAYFSTDQPMRGSYEQFYEVAEDETSSGTAAGTVNLANITVNGGTQLNSFYGLFGVGVVTASESMIGRITINSNDITPIQQISGYWQPVASGLGTAVVVMQPDNTIHNQAITMRSTATITAQNTLDEALTAAINIVHGVQFQRTPF